MKTVIRSVYYLALVWLVGATSCKEATKKTANDKMEVFVDTAAPSVATVIDEITIDSAGKYKTFVSESVILLDSNDYFIKTARAQLAKAKKPHTEKKGTLAELEQKNKVLREKVTHVKSVLIKDFKEFEATFKKEAGELRSKLANLTLGEDFD